MSPTREYSGIPRVNPSRFLENLLLVVTPLLIRSNNINRAGDALGYWGHPSRPLWSNICINKRNAIITYIPKTIKKSQNLKIVFLPSSSKFSPSGKGMSKSPWKLGPLYGQSSTMIFCHHSHENNVGLYDMCWAPVILGIKRLQQAICRSHGMGGSTLVNWYWNSGTRSKKKVMSTDLKQNFFKFPALALVNWRFMLIFMAFSQLKIVGVV